MTKSIIDAINLGKLKFSDILQNATIKFSDFNDNLFIRVYFEEPFQNENTWQHFLLGNPIESTAINRKHDEDYMGGRCFTYFNWPQHKWRKYKRPFNWILIMVNYDMRIVPKNAFNHVYVSIHSPNYFPELIEENFEVLTLGKGYIITYSQLHT